MSLGDVDFFPTSATHNMVFTLGLRHTFVVWQRAMALVQSTAIQTPPLR
ncbi:hypothetical protein RBSH_00026 [Rhodopirellula baltica SH28]|uniref:Uncharacterized protein n=1 Tax=Rhodopirellula baltica SH28 TaxID=993517 RepID=K5EFH5_RHOBT|nr:hypothetical protein RBSH_00026 [Rhodopirellula baltica SH28]